MGTIIASIPFPLGGGNHDLEVIRDGDKPPVGNADSSRQYDTWDGIDPATEDWIGYSYASPYTFNRVVFQEGREFFDGGWFDLLTVQVRQGGVWNEVSSLVITPSYPGANGQSYETFEMTFTSDSRRRHPHLRRPRRLLQLHLGRGARGLCTADLDQLRR